MKYYSVAGTVEVSNGVDVHEVVEAMHDAAMKVDENACIELDQVDLLSEEDDDD